MKKIDKIFLFFVSLIGLALSACILSLFYPIPFVTDNLTYLQSLYPYLNYVFAGYCAFVCLVFITLLFFSAIVPNKSNFLTITKDKGKLLFSKKTVESTVRYSFADLSEITSARIKVKLNKDPAKTRVYVTLSLNNKALSSLTESVQERISETLKSSLGITVKTIMIKTNEFIPGDSVKKVRDEDTSEVSRIS